MLTSLAFLTSTADAAASERDRDPRPNVVVITTDDQRLDQMGPLAMPYTDRFFGRRGTSFENAVVVSPSCCPSRAAYLTGQYPHNNGVLSNKPGYPALEQKRNTLPVWLQRAGYRTAHIGKYLHRYGEFAGWRNPAPGWRHWYTLAGTYRYFDYRIGKRGRSREFGDRPRDYLTRRLNHKATRFVRRNAPKQQPFYLQVDHLAPHAEVASTSNRCEESAQPDPTDLDAFIDTPLPQEQLDASERSFNEADVSDKSPALARRRILSEFVISKIERRYRCQLAALAGVDRGVRSLLQALRESGELRRTAIFFTSDNGFFHGEHRLPNNKGFPYEEGIRVPLLARLPPDGGERPATVSEPVANIDLTASVLELAEALPCTHRAGCRRLDGRSLVGLLGGGDQAWPQERPILIEQGRLQFFCAPYAAAWTPTSLYAEYPTKIGSDDPCEVEPEHYEMDTDPLQLDNLYPAGEQTAGYERQERLDSDLAELRRCSGVEGRDPPKRRRPFCR